MLLGNDLTLIFGPVFKFDLLDLEGSPKTSPPIMLVFWLILLLQAVSWQSHRVSYYAGNYGVLLYKCRPSSD